MSASGRRTGRTAALALGALLAACQPLPHPFADDRPPAALLQLRDTAGVAVVPVAGDPNPVATKLGAAVTAALLKREVPASDKTTGLGSYLLYGRVTEARPRDGKSAVTALWRLYDSRGQTVGEKRARLEAPSAEWASAGDAAIARLAALSADELVPLLRDEVPGAGSPAAPPSAPTGAQPPQDSGRVRVAVRKVTGAPGDGGTALAAAITGILKRQDLTLVEGGGAVDLYVEGEVAVGPVKAGKQPVKIVWRVRRADGAEIGTVGQENEVPRGLLDGAWGDVAYFVAMSAGDGVLQLVARGAPAPKSQTGSPGSRAAPS